MKAIIVFGMFLSGLALAADDEAAVRQVVQEFYMAFDEGFVKPVDFATDDWYHINPFGGMDRGIEATLKTVREVHTTFLKGITDTPEDIAIRFASDDVAVATVTSTMSPYTGPDGVKKGPQKQVRTFIVVKRGERWLIMQDHNTTVAIPASLMVGLLLRFDTRLIANTRAVVSPDPSSRC